MKMRRSHLMAWYMILFFSEIEKSPPKNYRFFRPKVPTPVKNDLPHPPSRENFLPKVPTPALHWTLHYWSTIFPLLEDPQGDSGIFAYGYDDYCDLETHPLWNIWAPKTQSLRNIFSCKTHPLRNDFPKIDPLRSIIVTRSILFV